MATVAFLTFSDFMAELATLAASQYALLVRIQPYHRRQSHSNGMPIFTYTYYTEAACETPHGDTLVCRIEIGSAQVLGTPMNGEQQKLDRLEELGQQVATALGQQVFTLAAPHRIALGKGLLVAAQPALATAPIPEGL